MIPRVYKVPYLIMKKVEVVAVIIICKDSILCCQRKTNKYPYLSEKFEFPGGKVRRR
tara:strand:+ start:5234 stop:5404 length:171 start_codon:yes stop_codon:yes gene_type:complete